MLRVMLPLLPPLVVALAPRAQDDFKWDQIAALGVKYKVSAKLAQVPLALGVTPPYIKAQYQPEDDADRIVTAKGSFPWEMVVVGFSKTAKNDAPKPTGDPAADERAARHAASNFRDYVSEKDPDLHERVFVVKDKDVPAKGKVLGHKRFEFTDVVPMTRGKDNFKQPYYSIAAVFDLAEAEVALVIRVPIKKEKENKADPKYLGIAAASFASLTLLSEKEAAGTGKPAVAKSGGAKEKFADTPAKKAQLELAKKNIAELEGWDFFTAPDYIVLYSWNPKKADKQPKQEAACRALVDKLEKMRVLYQELCPPNENLARAYSTIRMCWSADEYRKYGGVQDTDGYYFTVNKELIVSFDAETPKRNTDAVTFQQGWRQYADAYFLKPRPRAPSQPSEPKSDDPKADPAAAASAEALPSATLGEWFNEGLASYFYSHVLDGGKWAYEPSKEHKQALRAVLADKSFVPLRQIVTWDRERFAGARKTESYAEVHSFVDFLRRGKAALGAKWDESWSKILVTYRDTMLAKGDPKLANNAAFKDIDWDKLEAAWSGYVKDHF